MSTTTLSRNTQHVNNHRPKVDAASPKIEEIPAIWLELLTLESLAPIRLRGGIARARTALLSSVPAWMLPQFLDALPGGL